MPLVNKTGDPARDADGGILAERMSIRLSAAPKVTVVERAQLDSVLSELALSERIPSDPEKAVKLGKLLGANYLAFGSLTKLSDMFSVTVRMVNVETGEIVGGALVDGSSRSDFEKMSQEASTQLVAALTAKAAAP